MNPTDEEALHEVDLGETAASLMEVASSAVSRQDSKKALVKRLEANEASYTPPNQCNSKSSSSISTTTGGSGSRSVSSHSGSSSGSCISSSSSSGPLVFFGASRSISAQCGRKQRSREGREVLQMTAFFLLGAACVLPWDCVVLEMGTFHTRYMPTYPWIETSTEVRTLCLVVGHLLVFLLSPGLNSVRMTIGGCFTAAAACCCLALVAPLAMAQQGGVGGQTSSISAERSVFNASCIVVGVLGLCCSVMHAGVYGLHAAVCPSVAAAWALGGALAGPLSAAFALLLYSSISSTSPSISTRLLLGGCALWVVVSGCLLAAALRSPDTRRLLLLQRQQSQQRGPPTQQVAALSLPSLEAASTTTAAAEEEEQQQQQQQCVLLREVECESAARDPSPDIEAQEHEALLRGSSRAGSLWLMSADAVAAGRSAMKHQWQFYEEALKECRTCLICCFFLSLTTFVLYPIKVQHMIPCSHGDPGLFQLLLVGAYHVGVVVGRCVWTWCCSLSIHLVPPVLLLRLSLLPLLYWFESLPEAAWLQRAAEAAAAGSSVLQREFVLLLLDACRCFTLLVFSALHGHLSVVGAVHATRAPRTLPAREAAAFLMSLSDALGLAAGTGLSVLLPMSRVKPLDSWRDTAAATAHNLA
ncbi:hypothetical protein ACSSS7_001337 [Eimeria intestinalis]